MAASDEMQPRAFTFHPKLSRVALKLREPDRTTFVMACWEYGALGTLPNLPEPMAAYFESIREDLDFSVKKHRDGAKGGRPKKTSG